MSNSEAPAKHALRVITEELTDKGESAYSFGEVVPPGESKAFWVHRLRRLTIMEEDLK